MPNTHHPRWRIVSDELVTLIAPGNFKKGLILLNAIGYLAEKQAHHPVLTLREPLIKSLVSRVTEPKAAKRGRGRRS